MGEDSVLYVIIIDFSTLSVVVSGGITVTEAVSLNAWLIFTTREALLGGIGCGFQFSYRSVSGRVRQLEETNTTDLSYACHSAGLCGLTVFPSNAVGGKDESFCREPFPQALVALAFATATCHARALPSQCMMT